MKRRIAYASAIATLLTSAAAFPCGMSFGNNVTIDPHQDIIVGWKDGVETYAFQPTFCGTATDFGLILPVPSKLSQIPTTTDQKAFTTAATLSEPNKHEVTEQSSIGCGGSESRNGAPGGADDSPAVVASGRVGFLGLADGQRLHLLDGGIQRVFVLRDEGLVLPRLSHKPRRGIRERHGLSSAGAGRPFIPDARSRGAIPHGGR
jgi:hypothetical protein